MSVPDDHGGGLARGRKASRAPGERPLVVLGCRPLWAADGHLVGALGRRVRAARDRLGANDGWLLVTGGRTWGGVVEADAMREELVRSGVPSMKVVRERCSLTTWDNARLSAALLRRFGVGSITLVTCEWHLARAAAFFRSEGLLVDPLPVAGPSVPPLARLYRTGHEWVSARLHMSLRTTS